ncbi:MAG: hypothetical protein CMM45_03475 [Rhodospirillaceae bacterium]|nr:hypothetical protein [Rhodospirillaceae bacterium]
MVDKTREVRANQRLITERCFAVLVWIAGILGIFIPLYIITFITINGAPILSWAFLTLPPAGFPLGTGGGIGPAILGSLALITIGLSFSAPLSILAAIFSSQYCTSHNFLVFVRFFAEVLASVPSIIYGLFGYALLVVFFDLKISLLAGGITIAFMMTPVIFVGTHESFNLANKELQQAAISLGVSRLFYIRKVLLPKTLPSILTVIVLASMNAMGSAAPILLTGAIVNSIGEIRLDLPVMSLPSHIFYLVGEAVSFDHAFGTALVLVGVLIFGNMGVGWLKWRYIKNDG